MYISTIGGWSCVKILLNKVMFRCYDSFNGKKAANCTQNTCMGPAQLWYPSSRILGGVDVGLVLWDHKMNDDVWLTSSVYLVAHSISTLFVVWLCSVYIVWNFSMVLNATKRTANHILLVLCEIWSMMAAIWEQSQKFKQLTQKAIWMWHASISSKGQWVNDRVTWCTILLCAGQSWSGDWLFVITQTNCLKLQRCKMEVTCLQLGYLLLGEP